MRPAREDNIQTVLEQRVILSSDLAEIYGVPAKALSQAVNRNQERFPADFAFRLSKEEISELERWLKHQLPDHCLHRTRRRHGYHGPQQPPRRTDEHLEDSV